MVVLLVAGGSTAGAIYVARRWGSGSEPGEPEESDEAKAPESPPPTRPAADVAPPAVAMAVAYEREPAPVATRAAAGGGAAAVAAVASPGSAGTSGFRVPALAVPALAGATATALSTRATVVALVVLSLVAALVVDRFAGFGGPWLWNFDMSLANYPFAAYFHEAVTKGSLPFWQDRVGMGFPLYAEGQIGALYPPNWLIYQLPPLVALDVSRILHLTLAGVGGGLIVLRMTGSRTGAATTALVVVLCGGIASKLEWTQVVTVYGWMPWVLLPLLWRRPRPTRGLIVLAGVFWGIQALGGHPPYWVLTGIAAVTLIVVQAPHLRGAIATTAGRVVLFGLVGVGVGAVQLIPTLVITALSWRAQGVGSAALFEYSATPFDLLAVAFGNAFVPAQGSGWDLDASWYPGGSVWATLEVYAYVGLPALALAAMAFVTRRGRPLAILAAVWSRSPCWVSSSPRSGRRSRSEWPAPSRSGRTSCWTWRSRSGRVSGWRGWAAGRACGRRRWSWASRSACTRS